MIKRKKKIIFIKVFIVHLIVILLIDLNISAYIKPNTTNEININANFINLKSISLEDLEKKRALIKEKKRKLEEKKRKKLEALKKKKKLAAEKKRKEEKAKKLEALKKKKKLAAEKKRKEEQAKKKTLEKLKEDEESELANYELEKIEKELLEIQRIENLIKQQAIRNAQLSDAEQRYILTIKSKIENNWLIPHGTKHDKICTAIVNQLPSGKVTSVKIHGCKGDSLYIESLINAVWKSSPLPIAPDIEIFQENIVLQFEEPE